MLNVKCLRLNLAYRPAVIPAIFSTGISSGHPTQQNNLTKPFRYGMALCYNTILMVVKLYFCHQINFINQKN